MRKSKTVVIDLRTAAEGSADEQAQMLDAGITYYNLPIGRAGLPAGSSAEFATLLQAHKNQPVVVHCRSGNRAGLLWATHLIDEGASNKSALNAVDGILTSPGVRATIEGYTPPGKPD